MKIAALSDFHIGIAERMCALGHRHDDFQRFLDRLEASHDHIVLLGDIYQCDHGLQTGPDAATRQLASAQARTPWLTARLAQPNVTLVHGNHDAITASDSDNDKWYEFTAPAWGIYSLTTVDTSSPQSIDHTVPNAWVLKEQNVIVKVVGQKNKF